ncbi:MAG TPA: hypothetical protein VL689_01275 [Paraburkholderia sp.]|jgi:hypothetical protein|nr:hypothetical protein [Paraburkholderia sp.]
MMRAIMVAAVVLLSGRNGNVAGGFANGFNQTYATLHGGYYTPPPAQPRPVNTWCHGDGIAVYCNTY